MTTYAIERQAALPQVLRWLRQLPARVTRTVDALASARAARAVPEWQMLEVQGEIKRHLGHIRAGEPQRRKGPQRLAERRCE